MTTRIIEAFECTCDKCSYTWSSITLPATCANKTCRSPRWNREAVTTLIEKTPELEKKSAASPDIESSYSERAKLPLEHPEHPLNEEPYSARIPSDFIRHQMTGEEPPKRLHPERSDAERLAQIESLKSSIVDKENYKTKSVLPDYGKQPVVEDQPSYEDNIQTIT
jgi:hypothetical protein